VDDVLQLSGGGFDHGGLGVTDRRHTDAGTEVDELVAVHVDEDRTVGFGDVDGQCR